MRQSTTVLSAFWTATLLLSPIAAAAADTRYEAREDAVILAFLKNRLAEAGHPICFKPGLLAVHPDSIPYLQKLRPEPSTPASRAYAHDVVIWKDVSLRILGQERQVSIDGIAWQALHPRPATYGECAGTQITLRRVAIARSTAMIYGSQGNRCGSSTFGTNVRSIDNRWTPIHWKGYYAMFGPPGCGQLPTAPELAAMPGYVMIGEKR